MSKGFAAGMLISWKHNFLFIHVAKNGGTALTQALVPYARKEDRLAYSGLRLPVMNRLVDLYMRGDDPIERVTGFDAHVRYPKIDGRLGAMTIEPLFKFAIVRNPFTRAYSLYSHIRRSPDHHWHSVVKDKSMAEVLPHMIEEGWLLQAPFFCFRKSSVSAMDYHCAFENLAMDAKHVWAHLKLPKPPKLKRLNLDPQPRPEMRTAFGDQLDNFIAAMAPEFERFGYSTDIDRSHQPPDPSILNPVCKA